MLQQVSAAYFHRKMSNIAVFPDPHSYILCWSGSTYRCNMRYAGPDPYPWSITHLLILRGQTWSFYHIYCTCTCVGIKISIFLCLYKFDIVRGHLRLGRSNSSQDGADRPACSANYKVSTFLIFKLLQSQQSRNKGSVLRNLYME